MRRFGMLSLAATAMLTFVLVGAIGPAGAHTGAARRSSPSKKPVKIVILGDSTAFSLGWGLAATALGSKYHYTLADRGDLGCGIVNGPTVNVMGRVLSVNSECSGASASPGTPADEQPWPVQWKAAISKIHPNVVVLLAGRWEVVDRIYNGMWTNILSPTFANYVKGQLEFASNLVTSSGANMVFLTAPCISETSQSNGVAWPEDDPARLAAYNGLVRQVAAEHPTTDSVVDLSSVVCPGGTFSSTYKGVTIRKSDGVHFTEQAGLVLASALMPQIVSLGRSQMTRIAKSKHR
jgi:hypothetical protein